MNMFHNIWQPEKHARCFETQHTLFCEMFFLESMLVLSLKIDLFWYVVI